MKILVVSDTHRKDDNLSGFNPGGQSFGHMEVAKVEKPAVLTGNIQHRPAGAAVDHILHIPPQSGAVVLKILCIHNISSNFRGGHHPLVPDMRRAIPAPAVRPPART